MRTAVTEERQQFKALLITSPFQVITLLLLHPLYHINKEIAFLPIFHHFPGSNSRNTVKLFLFIIGKIKFIQKYLLREWSSISNNIVARKTSVKCYNIVANSASRPSSSCHVCYHIISRVDETAVTMYFISVITSQTNLLYFVRQRNSGTRYRAQRRGNFY